MHWMWSDDKAGGSQAPMCFYFFFPLSFSSFLRFIVILEFCESVVLILSLLIPLPSWEPLTQEV